jgi:hypothetical protein
VAAVALLARRTSRRRRRSLVLATNCR